MPEPDSPKQTVTFPTRQAWQATIIPLMAYIVSLLAPWFCFAPAPGECVCGFLALLVLAPSLLIEIVVTNPMDVDFWGRAIWLFSLAWPPIYWYLAICWICLEQPAYRTFSKINNVLLSLSALGAVAAFAVWLIARVVAPHYVQPAFLIASLSPLVSSLLFRPRVFKSSW